MIVIENQVFTYYHCRQHIFKTKSIQMTQNVEWDSVQGVWLNNRASVSVENEVFPSPLYLFGYGSLCFKPGDLLGAFTRHIATVNGYTRLFAQRSCDHRGTASFPGLVVTLAAQSSTTKEWFVTEEISCTGVVWVIPPDKATTVIEELDYRERGGYNRQYIDVEFQENTPYHKAGEIGKALVYTGMITNPNFYLPKTKLEAINIISAATGKSGENCEYLFKLLMFNQLNNLRDDYVQELAFGVWRRLGPWRARLFPFILSNRTLLSHEVITGVEVSENQYGTRDITCTKNVNLNSSVTNTNLENEMTVYGWGSNEFHQLTDQIEHGTTSIIHNYLSNYIFRLISYFKFTLILYR